MAGLQEQFVTDAKGNKKAVIISIKRFEKMNEDLHDLTVVAARKNEKIISFEDMKDKFSSK